MPEPSTIDQLAGAVPPALAPTRRRILLMPLGTWGDVIPFVQIGRELRRRGHEATLVACDLFEPLARRAELEFLPLFGREEYERIVANPRLWHPRWAGITFLREAVLPFVRRQFEIADDAVRLGKCDLLVAPAQSLGARTAQLKHDVPLATIHLAPYMFRSAIQSRRVSGVSLPDWFPVAWKRAIFRMADYGGDRLYGGGVNELLAELDLPPAARVFWEWWNSPERIIGLFPEWYAEPQADWPQQTVLTGFLPRDSSEMASVSAELEEFLRNGPTPIVFTAGTAMAHGRRFFKESLRATHAMGARAVFLSQFRDQLPESLPPEVMALNFAPMAKLLQHATAIVHHGGIGTTAQALAAGVPQLVVPMSFDQPDNAHRVEQLDVGRVMRPREYTADNVTAVLSELLGDGGVAARCEYIARRCEEADGVRIACDEIEALGRMRGAARDVAECRAVVRPR